jgi:hypothetical protein
MPKPQFPATGGAMPAADHPNTRRRFFLLVGHAGAAAAATATLASRLSASAAIAVSAGDDSELLRLLAAIAALRDQSDEIERTRVLPNDEEWYEIMHRDGWEAACKFGIKSGRDGGIKESNDLLEKADRLFERMLALPAQTQGGRAAKVKALLIHAVSNNEPTWRGPSDNLDFDIAATRSLLAQFAGMTEEEIASV